MTMPLTATPARSWSAGWGIGALAVVVSGLGVSSIAATGSWAREVPAFTSPVVDQAGVLDPGTAESLRQSLIEFQRTNGPQLATLIIPSLEGEPIEGYSIKVVDRWKLGDAKRDDGALLLVSIGDRQMRIEVGQGLEGQLPDIIAGRIISGTITPLFREGRIDAGIVSGLQAIAERLGGALSGAPVASQPRTVRRTGAFRLSLPVLLFLFLVLPRILFPFRRRRGGLGTGLATGLLLGSMGRRNSGWGGGGGFGGFGGGGGGGWSGGGGGFSGGGASGSW